MSYTATWADDIAQQLVKSVTLSAIGYTCKGCDATLVGDKTCQRELQARIRNETEEDKKLKDTMAILKDFGLEETEQFKGVKSQYNSLEPEFRTYTCDSKETVKHENVIDHYDSKWMGHGKSCHARPNRLTY